MSSPEVQHPKWGCLPFPHKKYKTLKMKNGMQVETLNTGFAIEDTGIIYDEIFKHGYYR